MLTVIEKITVGCEEWCALPGLDIPAIKVRVDSGAKTSSLHAFNVHAFKCGDEPWVRFDVHPLQKNRKTTVSCEAQVVDRRMVKNSGGGIEKRYVIKVPIAVRSRTWTIELTLANRDSMGYRMLLGREAMAGRMVIDPEESFCLGAPSASRVRRLYGIPAPLKKSARSQRSG